jgi:hypothetical protein
MGKGFVKNCRNMVLYSLLMKSHIARNYTIVWLDYNLWVIMTRLVQRTFRRVFLHEELWNGNRERLGNAMFSKDSILLWALQTYHKNRHMYTELILQPEYAHLSTMRLRSPQATRLWLNEVHKLSKQQ